MDDPAPGLPRGWDRESVGDDILYIGPDGMSATVDYALVEGDRRHRVTVRGNGAPVTWRDTLEIGKVLTQGAPIIPVICPAAAASPADGVWCVIETTDMVMASMWEAIAHFDEPH